MKIGIQTWGSEGDIRPFIALAEGLQTDGHEVTLVTTRLEGGHADDYRSPAGVTILPVSSPVIATKQELQTIERAIFAESDPITQTQLIIEKLFLPAERRMFEASENLCLENDLVIGHFFHYPLHAAAKKHGRPFVSVTLVHSAIPSKFQPPSGMPNLGALGNRLSWKLVRAVLNKRLKKYSDAFCVGQGLAVARDLVADVWASEKLTLIAVSPALCERRRDWPETHQVCGFLSPPNSNRDDQLPAELEKFLAAGTPPVYITFGSVMADNDPETIALFCTALELAGARAIIQVPDLQNSAPSSTAQCHFVGAAPHHALFPRCNVIVHHGGAGTTQSTLRAGRPSIVVAHTSEQMFWGRELARLGVSTKPIMRNKLTAERLAQAITTVIEAPDFARAASRVGAEMARENGIAKAVQLINARFSANLLDAAPFNQS